MLISPLLYFITGLVTLILTNPIWVTKTRLCLQYGRGTGPTSGGVFYKGTIDALFKIYKMEGIRGLYKVCITGLDKQKISA